MPAREYHNLSDSHNPSSVPDEELGRAQTPLEDEGHEVELPVQEEAFPQRDEQEHGQDRGGAADARVEQVHAHVQVQRDLPGQQARGNAQCVRSPPLQVLY